MRYTNSYGEEREIPVLRVGLWTVGVLAAFVLVIGAIVAAVTLRQERVNESEIGVYYTDGPFEGRHFEKVMEPGSSEWVANDHVYKLPARQITWISGPGNEADTTSLVFTASGGERMVMELTTRMLLNTTLDDEGEPFKSFFTDICQKFDCWEGALDGNPNPENGWDKMLLNVVGNPQQAAANQLGLEYSGEALRYDNNVREQFADAFAEEFERLMTDEVGVGNIFCGPGYVRGEQECPPINVKVTNVTFENTNREGIREQERLAERQQQLAVSQEAAAIAQQRVNAAQATPEYETLKTAEAMIACAQKPECAMTFIVGADNIPPSVPVG